MTKKVKNDSKMSTIKSVSEESVRSDSPGSYLAYYDTVMRNRKCAPSL